MPNKKISELVRSSPTAADILPVARAGVNYGITAESLRTFIQTGVTNHETRASLAASTDITRNAYLTESKRDGFFIWDSSNLSAQVAADPQQGQYVAPSSDPTGGSGAWVRQSLLGIKSEWFGAVADGVTSDSTAYNAALNTGKMVHFDAGSYNLTGYNQKLWNGRVRKVQSTDDINGYHGEYIYVMNTTDRSGYGVRFAEYNNTGTVSLGRNDIADTLLVRHTNITNGASWARWDVSASPLHHTSGLPTAPATAQNFAMVMAELNPLSRNANCGKVYDARHWVNWHGGVDLVPETQDFWGELGAGQRRGYTIAFAYGIAKSPYTNSDEQRHARSRFGLFARPNAIAGDGSFLMATGHRSFVLTVTVSAAGSGYVVGDLLTFDTGLDTAANENTVVRVKAVDGSGGITSAEVYNSGWYQQTFATPIGVTGGTGTGATFTYTLSDNALEAPQAWGSLAGSWYYGLDGCPSPGVGGSWSGQANFIGGMIRAANNEKIIVGRNAANTANVTGLLLGTDDLWQLADHKIVPPRTYVPVITADSGTIESYEIVNATYSRINGRAFVDVTFKIVTVGTATGGLKVSWPVATTKTFLGNALNITTSEVLKVLGNVSSSGTIRIVNAAGTNVAAAGEFYTLSTSYPL